MVLSVYLPDHPTVHIEIVEGSDTDACMMALTRFMARRGRTQSFVSDKETNFVGAEREFRETAIEWNQTLILQSLEQQSVVWVFNPREHRALEASGNAWLEVVRKQCILSGAQDLLL